MARIPDGEIERLKREVDLAALVEGSGVSLRRHGANGDLIGRCPFHDDHEPSLVVSPKGPTEADLWHCLGACQAGGTVFDWIMKKQKVSFRHAVEILRESAAGGEASGASPRSRWNSESFHKNPTRRLRWPVTR